MLIEEAAISEATLQFKTKFPVSMIMILQPQGYWKFVLDAWSLIRDIRDGLKNAYPYRVRASGLFIRRRSFV